MRNLALVAALGAASLGLAACGGGEQADESPGMPGTGSATESDAVVTGATNMAGGASMEGGVNTAGTANDGTSVTVGPNGANVDVNAPGVSVRTDPTTGETSATVGVDRNSQ